MTDRTCESSPPTYYAPAERDEKPVVEAIRQNFLANALAVTLLDAIPDLALVINTNRQIIAANKRLLEAFRIEVPEEILGLRHGELLGCVNSKEAPGGCGTSTHCAVCGAIHAILEAIHTQGSSTHECRIRTDREKDGGALDLEVQATYFTVDDTNLVMVAMRDISAQKRRDVLERTFFHDVLNTAAGLQAVAELLNYGEEDPDIEEEYRQDLRRLSTQIADEIKGQRQLLAAETGELELNVAPVAVPEIIEAVAEMYRHHSVARERSLVIGDCPDIEIKTDATLVRRVLGNLVKNAFEAIIKGETVTISAEETDGKVLFKVRNPGVIPADIQKQIFQRSFTTKEGSGRGIGTHSVKLLTEGYLGGAAGFTSDADNGTIFTVEIPKEHAEG